jgi:hypothetical protein
VQKTNGESVRESGEIKKGKKNIDGLLIPSPYEKKTKFQSLGIFQCQNGLCTDLNTQKNVFAQMCDKMRRFDSTVFVSRTRDRFFVITLTQVSQKIGDTPYMKI